MNDIIKFLEEIGKLKKIKRTGWVINKIPEPESVAEHIFRVSIMALIFSDKFKLDENKCIKMAMIHDLAEALEGDITPYDKIDEKSKHEIEEKAMKKLIKEIDNKEILELWQEYEEKNTPEAKFVYDLDKFEMLLQAYEYEKKYNDINLQNFWDMWKNKIENDKLKEMCEFIFSKRNL